MEEIRDSFRRVKEDISFLNEEITQVKESISSMKEDMLNLCKVVEDIREDLIKNKLKSTPTFPQSISTQEDSFKTTSTHSSTVPQEIRGSNTQNLNVSIGNEGVPTNKQTIRQTNNQTDNMLKNQENSLKNASDLLDSLDAFKRELRLKMKRLTEQEVVVFSTIYQLEEERGDVDYKAISNRLKLTESSIRDYVGRLIKKGIPVDKTKLNNKTILLSVSSGLRKIASLHTILQLRDL